MITKWCIVIKQILINKLVKQVEGVDEQESIGYRRSFEITLLVL